MLNLFLYRDGALTAIESGNRTSIIAVLAESYQDADAIVVRELAKGAGVFFANFTTISFTGCTWTDATKTIEDPLAGSLFADYTYEANDKVYLNAFTSVGTFTEGLYTITGKTDDTLVLSSDPVSGDNDGTAVGGYIVNVRRIDYLNTDFNKLKILQTITGGGSTHGQGYETSLPGVAFEIPITAA